MIMAFQTRATSDAPHPTSSFKLGALFRSKPLILMPTCCTQYAGCRSVVAAWAWFHKTYREFEIAHERGSAGHGLIIIDIRHSYCRVESTSQRSGGT
ncbi:hypothetical protein PAXRUDRAFT_280574 [Paxillus rubicundulus Ve08.2h10]|uniref:Uncharacterized protein n=1 Tax=Paxillus rubicundulus Ve08.2h10 TaxID=930991 RepID=A0A0D0DEU4_9AGAM|nr:hypothetical protein PAXRUDRAFT_280574 [Paxillus rubicundulus Ve08.2h10]